MSEAASEVIEIGDVRRSSGVYLLVVAAGTAQITARWAVWVLPFALIVDNLTFGLAGEQTGSLAGDALAMALSSAFLAFLGLLVGRAGSRACFRARSRCPADRRGRVADRGRVRSSLRAADESQAVELAAALRRAASSTSMRTP